MGPVTQTFDRFRYTIHRNTPDGEAVINFFLTTKETDDKGYPRDRHIGFIEIDEVPNYQGIIEMFKKKFPEELL